MALANFLDKAALHAAQTLKNFNRDGFERVLLSNTVEIVFDNNATSSFEGRATLDLLVRLLTRLYPNIIINNIDSSSEEVTNELKSIAKGINPLISLDNGPSTVVIVVGKSSPKNVTTAPIYYIGSNNWTAKFSTQSVVGSGGTVNPFGGGAAACFAAANIFRSVFQSQLPYGSVDDDFSFSVFSLHKDALTSPGPEIGNIHIDETHLIGLGAIGNGVVWALSHLTNLTGTLHCIDHENLGLSNLQRYALTNQLQIEIPKVEIAEAFLSKTKLNVKKWPLKWNEYLKERKNSKIERVAIGVDSAEDRIQIQGSLPHKIFNAWTQAEALGISRHIDFENAPCLTCLYLPDSKKKSRSEEVAENLGLNGTDSERKIREYLALGKPVDDELINLVSTTNKIPIERLTPFIGKGLESFYSDVVCGGVLMAFGAKDESPISIDVPSAFESTLAGILLAAEIIIDAQHWRTIPATVTRINLMRPLTKYLSDMYTKHNSQRCICQDEDYVAAYKKKYAT